MEIVNDKKIYIFGAGKYGTALFNYLNKCGVNVEGFIKTIAEGEENKFEKPVLSLDFFRKEKRDESRMVAIALGNKEDITQVRSYLITDCNMAIEDILDFKSFIESNHLTELPKYFCNVCGNSSASFLPMGFDYDLFDSKRIIGAGRRENATCPICGSIDRIRWFRYVIENYTAILESECRVLHFAPEWQLKDLFDKNTDCEYISADIEKGKAMMTMDMVDIPFCDERFDYVIANHVLEHVPNEKKAVSEIRRILKSDGVALLSFPICMDINTIEDPELTDKEERIRLFGQEDHIRLYGRDYKERFESYGFKVAVKSPEDCLGESAIKQMKLIKNDVVLLCTKQ